jgi:NAD(P)-dependent dehydrogenase (short-subunit alcohol dehydrogenase family)
MDPEPIFITDQYRGSRKLQGKVAVITGGDSGIGRSVAVHFAREGANIVIVYLSEDEDANQTLDLIEQEGQECLLIKGDVSSEAMCQKIIEQAIDRFGALDILVNNAAKQFPHSTIEEITQAQLEETFQVNIFSFFYLTKAALKYLQPGSTIINTTSVVAYKGNPQLIDYSATKGAIVSFTRSLSQNLVQRNIRVNAVAPGPIWTPLIPSTFPQEKVENFGKNTPMQRPGQPYEVAPCFVFLASEDSTYITGQTLHPNGGEIVNG